MSPMFDLLKEMRGRRLAMYLGTVSILKLADFLRGYAYAIEKLGDGQDHLLGGFRDWVQKKFATTQSWENTILLHSDDETRAVDRFWQLLDEYLLETKSPALLANTPDPGPLPTNGTSKVARRSRRNG